MSNPNVSAFVSQLLSNPNLQNESPLLAEGFVLAFIVNNLKQLQFTFKSPQFFPDLEPRQALNLVFEELKSQTLSKVMPTIEKGISEMDFQFILKNSKTAKTYSSDFFREKLIIFANKILENKDVRRNFNSVYHIFSKKVFERYISESFFARTPLYFELARVGKRNYSPEEYVNFLKLLLVLRAAAYDKRPLEGFSENNVGIEDFLKTPKSLAQYLDSKATSLYKELPGIPKEMVRQALLSNVNTSLQDATDTPAKFLYIVCTRYQSYKEYDKVDRGAESPDKSWFGIAKKNANHFGYDKRIIDDLYILAGDNNW